MSRPSTLHRVVVATDGSPLARLATTVAAAQDAGLMVVHVAAPTEYRVARMATPSRVTRRLDDPFGDPVLSEARRLCFDAGVACKMMLLAGDPVVAVVLMARSVGAELVVLGAGRRRPLGLSRGRTARRVEAGAPCPVLIVRRAAVVAVGPRPLPHDRRARAARRGRSARPIGASW